MADRDLPPLRRRAPFLFFASAFLFLALYPLHEVVGEESMTTDPFGWTYITETLPLPLLNGTVRAELFTDTDGYRGVRATQRIRKGEVVMEWDADRQHITFERIAESRLVTDGYVGPDLLQRIKTFRRETKKMGGHLTWLKGTDDNLGMNTLSSAFFVVERLFGNPKDWTTAGDAKYPFMDVMHQPIPPDHPLASMSLDDPGPFPHIVETIPGFIGFTQQFKSSMRRQLALLEVEGVVDRIVEAYENVDASMRGGGRKGSLNRDEVLDMLWWGSVFSMSRMAGSKYMTVSMRTSYVLVNSKTRPPSVYLYDNFVNGEGVNAGHFFAAEDMEAGEEYFQTYQPDRKERTFAREYLVYGFIGTGDRRSVGKKGTSHAFIPAERVQELKSNLVEELGEDIEVPGSVGAMKLERLDRFLDWMAQKQYYHTSFGIFLPLYTEERNVATHAELYHLTWLFQILVVNTVEEIALLREVEERALSAGYGEVATSNIVFVSYPIFLRGVERLAAFLRSMIAIFPLSYDEDMARVDEIIANLPPGRFGLVGEGALTFLRAQAHYVLIAYLEQVEYYIQRAKSETEL